MFNYMSTFMLLGCLFWPLWSAIICGVFGYRLGTSGARDFAVGCLLLTLLSASWLVIKFGLGEKNMLVTLSTCFNLMFIDSINPQVIESFTQDSSIINNFMNLYNNSHSYSVIWGLYCDTVTCVMLFVISSISFVVHLYATSYMATDPHQARFFSNLSLFTFFMMVLVTANNYFQLFVGWEGVGLCSYLLIGFWYTRLQANKSALQALVVNKVGDFALVIAIITLFLTQGTTSFQTTFALSHTLMDYEILIGYWSITLGNFIGFLFFMGAVAKSAQIGLHTWLLSAMEGPTPVSALLHAATMVTAGIFLMIRSSVLWTHTPDILFLMTICGAMTAFFAATCGVVQHDIKKIIAFSTCSQLGYMFYTCGLGEYSASLYHLTNHAFFKALLFLGAGAVIHALSGEQDIRRMGGLAQIMPVTYVAMLIASLALVGFPFLSGFYSKDILIELAWVQGTVPGTFTFWLATVSAMLTAFYSSRLLYLVFLAEPAIYKSVTKSLIEADSIMLWSFRLLMIGSLFSGYFLFDAFVGFGGRFNSVMPALLTNELSSARCLYELSQSSLLDSEFLPSSIKLLPVILSLVGIGGAFILYTNTFQLLQTLSFMQVYNNGVRIIHHFLIKKWYFDIIYNYYIARIIYNIGLVCYEYGDQGVLEWLGPQGLYTVLASHKFARQSIATNHLEWLIIASFGLIIFTWFLI